MTMSLISRGIIFIIFIIVCVIGVNIFSFQKVVEYHFFVYTKEATIFRDKQQKQDELNLALSGLSLEGQKLYQELDTSLQEIATNLKEGVQKTVEQEQDSYTPESNPQAIFAKGFGLALFTNEYDSPETRFIKRVIFAMATINIILLAVVAIAVYLFLYWVFRPLRRVVRYLKDFSPESHIHSKIAYSAHDEFGMLVDTVNTLSRRLQNEHIIRSRFLADISHEIKTPITGMRCLLEGVQDGAFLLGDKLVSSLLKEIKRMSLIVQQLSLYERAQNTQVPIHRENIYLEEFLPFFLHEYAKMLEEKKQQIILEDMTAPLFADESACTQIVHNLISNFIKYAGPETSLFIKTQDKGAYVHCIFHDNGPGITAEHIPYVKEKFYQVDDSKSLPVDTRGMGVGLSIVEALMNRHGGDFLVLDTQGKGFHAELIFPKADEIK